MRHEEQKNPESEGATQKRADFPIHPSCTCILEAINERMSKRGPAPLYHRRKRKQRLACDDHKPRKNRQHRRTRKRASRPSPRQLLHVLHPRGPEHADPVGGVQRDAEDEHDVECGAARGPAVQRGLDVLIVELGGAKGRDGRRGIGGCKAVCEKVNGKEEESGGIAGHGKRAGERACGRTCGTWGGRGEEALEERARRVHEKGREDEIALTEYGLVVLAPEQLRGGGANALSRRSAGQRDYKLTMVLDEAEEPPRLAAAGAAR